MANITTDATIRFQETHRGDFWTLLPDTPQSRFPTLRMARSAAKLRGARTLTEIERDGTERLLRLTRGQGWQPMAIGGLDTHEANMVRAVEKAKAVLEARREAVLRAELACLEAEQRLAECTARRGH